MPTDRRAKERRRAAILAILEVDSSIGEQQELVERLAEMGIPSTQSSVSRDLKALGVVRAGGCYTLPSRSEGDSLFTELLPFIMSARAAGPHMTIIKTFPGAGPLVAQGIEAAAWMEVVGTVGGSDSVLALTDGAFGQRVLLGRLKRYMGP